MDADLIQREIDLALLSPLVREVRIPPRPSLLQAVQDELQSEDPDPRRLAHLVSGDVAMSAALLKIANSPLMGLTRRAETVEQTFILLGMLNVEALLVEITLRREIGAQGPALHRFWDVATKRAHAMAFLARRERLAPSDIAHTLGLFLDVGIALLMLRPLTPPYLNTLNLANESEAPFTEIERERHGTDHALVGAAMARSWGVSQTVQLAVRLHHEYTRLPDPATPKVLRDLVALSCVVDHAIQRHEGRHKQMEWQKAGPRALQALGLNEAGLEDWVAELHSLFDHEA